MRGSGAKRRIYINVTVEVLTGAVVEVVVAIVVFSLFPPAYDLNTVKMVFNYISGTCF